MKELDKKRFYSHIFQIYLILDLDPKELLEIGSGDGFVSNFIGKKEHLFLSTLDVDGDKNPDWNVDISNLKALDNLPNDFFDVILICEVLEHIPFKKVEGVLRVLKKKTKKNIIISVPDQTKYLNLNISKHGFSTGKLNILIKIIEFFVGRINKFMEWIFRYHYKFINKKKPYISLADGEHYWELGINKYSVKDFKNMLEFHFDVVLDERVKEFPWHHFFVLQKKEKKFKVPRDPDIDPITFTIFSKI